MAKGDNVILGLKVDSVFPEPHECHNRFWADKEGNKEKWKPRRPLTKDHCNRLEIEVIV